MSVIGINGSPRSSGATAALVYEVLAGAAECGVGTRIFHLGEMAFSGCTACMGCRETARCAIDDDMRPMYEAIERNAGRRALVIGTPIYFDHVSAQLKAWLDRLYAYTYTKFGERMFPKGYDAAIVLTFDWDKADAYRCVEEWLADRLRAYHAIRILGSVTLCNATASPLSDRPDIAHQAREMGRRLALGS
jgi:multimeric flavodoxin WrbA